MSRRIDLLFLMTLLVACAGKASPPQVERRDSAGIVIVESHAPSWDQLDAWVVDSLPILELTGASPAYEFSRVPDATVLPDGKLVVLDAAAREVRFFDRDGVFIRAVGRQGEGPGEFDRLTSVAAARGDSVLVFDYWLRRATVLDSDGNIGRVFIVAANLQLHELHSSGDDAFVAVTWSLDAFMDVEGPYRGRYLILGVAPDGVVRDTVATITGWSGFKVNREDGAYSDYASLFSVDGHVSASPAGIVMGDAERMEFARYSVAGRLERIVRAPVLDQRLTPDEVREQRASMLSPESTADYRALVERMPAPELRPAYSDLQIDAEGFVWVGPYQSRYRRAGSDASWKVFAPDGAWLGALRLPERFALLEIGSDYLLGSKRDALGVDRIQLLRLRR